MEQKVKQNSTKQPKVIETASLEKPVQTISKVELFKNKLDEILKNGKK